MKTITATELARNLRQVLDRLAVGGEEVIVERNHQMVARILPGIARQTALEAMSDLYRTLPEEAAAGWLESGRQAFGSQLDKDVRDPWVS
jgi:antitoxin (DNA-binding transcriptional repressor) of toxin-antitoxin stability system